MIIIAFIILRHGLHWKTRRSDIISYSLSRREKSEYWGKREFMTSLNRVKTGRRGLIHSTAIIGKKSKLGRHVAVGPFSVIEDGVSIGDDVTILDHVFIGCGTRMGGGNTVFTGAALGHRAQNKSTLASEGLLEIGSGNIFREYVTVHRGALDKSVTRIGDHNYFMALSHAGHDCEIQNYVTIANAVLLAGHVVVEDHCMLGGGCGIHQFCRLGRYAMIGGHATVTKDVPPYTLIGDNESLIGSLNVVGLRRAGFSEQDKRDIKNAYKLLYRTHLNTSQALEAVTKSCRSAAVAHLVDFIRASKRGILGHR